MTTGIQASKAVDYAVLQQPSPDIAVSKAVGYAVIIDIGLSIAVSKAVGYAVVSESTAEPPYDDGTPSGGIVTGGEVVEITTINFTDGAVSGGIVFGSEGDISQPENHQSDGISRGGIVFGGAVSEQWTSPWVVAVKGGTYRISGGLYMLQNTLSYEGLGDIAAIVPVSAPPTTVGYWRYDLLSIDSSQVITVTYGLAAAAPVMPATPTGQIKLNHILRYCGQERIAQADIGKLYVAPKLTSLQVTVTDDDLAWGETGTTIEVQSYDQYGVLYSGGATINAAIDSGNGTISPAARSGHVSSFSFTYTRGGNDPGDVSPMLKFSSPTGPYRTVFIKLRDAAGDLMI